MAPRRGPGPLAAVRWRTSVLVFDENAQPYALALAGGEQRWVQAEVTPDHRLLPVAGRFALCAGDDCLWLHGGLTRCQTVGSALFRISVEEAQGGPGEAAIDLRALTYEPLRRLRRATITEEPWVLGEGAGGPVNADLDVFAAVEL
jgi:hypothetical protein